MIPKFLKSFKKSKTLRRQHNNPQSTPIHNIQDFYPDGYNLKYEVPVQLQVQQQEQIVDGFDQESKFRQRRQKSFSHVHYVDGRYSSGESGDSSKQIVRFRSHRRMFSCIGGSWNRVFFFSVVFTCLILISWRNVSENNSGFRCFWKLIWLCMIWNRNDLSQHSADWSIVDLN